MTIPVALIGFGFAGRGFHAPLITATEGLRLAVIGSSRPEAARAAYPEAEVVADPFSAARHPAVDLVVIATPNDSHAPLAEAALRAGKHVVVDKPFTITVGEARSLAAMAAEVRRVLSVFQNRRWDSDFLGVSREIAAGRIGEIVELRSEIARYRPEVRDRWRERAGPGSGLWYDLGPHLIDQALVLFGPPESVHADLQVQREGGFAVDWFHAILRHGRTQVILTSSMLALDASPRFMARGSKGGLNKRGGDPQEDQLLSGKRPGGPGWGEDPDPLLVLPPGEAPVQQPVPPGNYLAYYAAIRDAIHGGGLAPVTPAQATTVMMVIEAGIRSSAEGRTVSPSYTDAEQRAWSPCAPGRQGAR